MKFTYQARTKEGEIKKGVIEAISKMNAIDLLHKNDLFPTLVNDSKKGIGISTEIKIFSHVSSKEVVMFTRELAIMIESNVPPSKALGALGDQTNNIVFKEVIFKVLTK